MKEAGAFAHNDHCQKMTNQISKQGRVPLIAADLTSMQKDVYAFLSLVEDGRIPNAVQDPALFDKPFSEIVASPEYKDVIRERAAQITPDQIRNLQNAIKTRASQMDQAPSVDATLPGNDHG